MATIKLTEQQLTQLIKEAVHSYLNTPEWNQAWEEYEQLPDDESEFDEVIQSKGLDTPFGSAYCHSFYKGDYDPMVRAVHGNTLRDMATI